jgi:hypothetical protein
MNTLTSIWLFLIAAPASLAVFWQGARRGKVGHGWMASVSVLLVASTLLSPQFLGWLMPGAALAWPERGRRLTVACAAAGLLSILPLPPPFIVLRNVLLALMAADASLAVMRAERAVPPGG